MTTAIATPGTLRSNTFRPLRGGRTALVALIVGAATAAAVFAGGGTASANPSGPTVVGMSEQQAHKVLSDSGTPYLTMVRIGGVAPCIVTEQRDLGNTVIGRTDSDGDRVETTVWKGLGLSIRCS